MYIGEARKVGGGQKILVTQDGDGYKIVNPEDPKADVSMWEVNYSDAFRFEEDLT